MICTRLIEWRGRTALRLAEILAKWAKALRKQANRDIARSMKPDDLLRNC